MANKKWKQESASLKQPSKFYTTEEMAAALCMRPQSIRKRYNQNGSYYGIVPNKLPNKRLLWPIHAVEALKHGKEI